MTESLSRIGKIHSAFGVQGFAKVEFPGSTIFQLPLPITLQVKLPTSFDFQTLTIISMENRPNYTLVQFQDIKSPESLQPYRNAELYLPSHWIPDLASETEFYTKDLIGLSPVCQSETSPISVLTDFHIKEILDLPHDSILIFQSNQGEEVCIPFRKEFVGKVNLSDKTIEIPSFQDFLYAN